MKTRFFTLLLCLLSPFSWASGLVEVSHPWAKETPPTVTTSAIFLTITNPTAEERALVSASTEAAGITELHTHKMDNGVMKMRKLQRINLSPKADTELKPHGLHIMLFDLKEPLKEGMVIPLTLTFDTGRTMTLSVPVKKMAMKQHHH
ncbi:copper metallochaperone [Vibrio ishigakensis]|uniref:Copper metallochaperone n=1 Tax=Vibrio ishigakensis TaxID=1481914 RepID=A0A0B8PA40_9VIBR|nr:copper metallochaperone [Vibrio ishigakensis]